MTITIITGTDTDVGKTIATATIAVALRHRGRDIRVVKPVQTGVGPDEAGDLAIIAELAGVPSDCLVEGARLSDPLAPTTAARRAGVRLASMAQVAASLVDLADAHHVLVEGAGGLLVGLDEEGAGLLRLADELTRQGQPPRFVVVTRCGLGTLNHTQLTVDAIRRAGHQPAGLVIGAWPEDPGLAEQCNAADLTTIAPVLATLPSGLGTSPDRLCRVAVDLAAPLTGALV